MITRRLIILVCALWPVVVSAQADEGKSMLLEAQNQFEDAHYEQALKLYKQANESAGADPFVAYNMGLCHLKLGDGDNAIRHFEEAAGKTDSSTSLRRDAFYNIGVIRATSARGKLQEILTPATQPADKKPTSTEHNVEEMQAIADELIKAITAFKASEKIEPDADADHNIRAARITRREVLGLLRKAIEEKEKRDMLDDPRAYLEELMHEQLQQVSISRYLVMIPIEEPERLRHARRAAIRLQRKTMERTGTFIDHLAQYKEKAQDAGVPTSTQPVKETPREQLYHLVAKLLEPAIESQRDACAFFLDGQIDSAYKDQKNALEQIRTAAGLFPVDPPRELARLWTEQKNLIKFVEAVEKDAHWLRDPMLGEVSIPDDIQWDAKDTALYDLQGPIGQSLAKLAVQCRQVSASTQPAAGKVAPNDQNNPALNPELNAKAAEILEGAADVQESCLKAIADRNKPRTAATQKKILEIIEKALDLYPKSIEQRIAELIVQQDGLNKDTRTQAGGAQPGTKGKEQSLLDKVHDLAAKLKSAVFPSKPSDIAGGLGTKQRELQEETRAVGEDLKKNIPSGSQQTAPAGGQQEQIQAHIEAGKHIDSAEFEMLTAIEGLDKATVENSLKPLQVDGPVQNAQSRALEELKKALAALTPPENQPEQQQDQEQKQDEQQQQEPQDIRRTVDRMDKERQEAERKLYQRRPRTVIKDW